VEKPIELEGLSIIIAAALVELFTDRLHITHPIWTKSIGASKKPIWLVRKDLPRFAKWVEQTTPEPLRRRNIYAPITFLSVI
jgi:hypothetical protein